MPRSLEQILAHADELAERFERHESDPSEIRDAAPLRAVRQAVLDRAHAESEVAACVSRARAEGHSWQAIGAVLGTSGEAARQRYGRPTRAR